jgi:CBS domain-containing protein
MKIKEVLAAKSVSGVVTITADSTVRDLLALLAEHNIGAVIVSSDGASVDGIVSERDIVRNLNGDDSVLGSPVSQIMTAAVHTVGPDDLLETTRRLMTEHRVRHVPVVADGALAGIVSIGDVVKSHIDQVEFERDQLDSYVHQT